MEYKIKTEDEIYEETMQYFNKFKNVKSIDRLPLIHFRLENKGLTLEEALSVLEKRNESRTS